MTVQTTLREGQSILFYAEVETPVLDAVVLLAEALGVTKERLLASLPEEVGGEDYGHYRHLIDLRCSGRPVSYIRKKKEFYSLDFYVDERVLVPRPDTETLVEEALLILQGDSGAKKVHDVCTGSGCIAIALKSILTGLEISASDISPEAGAVFRLNSESHLGCHLPFWLSDLLQDVPGKFDLIIANPPYLKDQEVENMKKIGWPEPDLALKGGPEGTTLIRRLIRQLPEKLESGAYFLLEADRDQMEILTALLEAAGLGQISVIKDLAGRERVIKAEMLH
ncbi:Release factor glutamine methyltransferase [subsurface metagenome]